MRELGIEYVDYYGDVEDVEEAHRYWEHLNFALHSIVFFLHIHLQDYQTLCGAVCDGLCEPEQESYSVQQESFNPRETAESLHHTMSDNPEGVYVGRTQSNVMRSLSAPSIDEPPPHLQHPHNNQHTLSPIPSSPSPSPSTNLLQRC